jgi:predicted anti-sigma-YlaC factor YlaD
MKQLMTAALAALTMTGCATQYAAKWDEKPTTATGTVDASTAGDADAAWAARKDPAKLMEAIGKWEAIAASSADAEVYAKLARAWYLAGERYAFEEKNDKRDEAYQKGLDWATKSLKVAAPEFASLMSQGKQHAEAITKAPKEAVSAMYWFSANLGKWAATKGFATRLRYKDDIKATVDTIKGYDDKFFYAAPWRVLGGFEAQTAGLAGGSLEKSEEYFKKAVELAPNYLGTKVLWADYLCVKRQDKATFEKLLKDVVAANPAAEPEIEAENLLEQEKAKKLLAQIDEKF